MRKKIFARIKNGSDYEFIEEGENYVATVKNGANAGEGTMTAAGRTLKLLGEFPRGDQFHLHETDPESRRSTKRIATISGIATNSTSPSIEYGGRTITLHAKNFFGWFGIRYLFRKFDLAIVQNSKEMGSIQKVNGGFLLQYWGDAPKEIQTFLLWGILYGSNRPTS